MQQLAAKNTDIAALSLSVPDATSGSFTQTIENGQQQPETTLRPEDSGEFKAIYAQVSDERTTQPPATGSTNKQRAAVTSESQSRHDNEANQSNTSMSTSAEAVEEETHPDTSSGAPDSELVAEDVFTQVKASDVKIPTPPRDGRIELPPVYTIQPITPSPLSDNALRSLNTPMESDHETTSEIVSLVESVMQVDDSLTALVNHHGSGQVKQIVEGEIPEAIEETLPITPSLLSGATDNISAISAEETSAELLPFDGRPLPERMTIQPIDSPAHPLSVAPNLSSITSTNSEVSGNELPEDQVAENVQQLLNAVQNAKQNVLNSELSTPNLGSDASDVLASLEAKINALVNGTAASLEQGDTEAFEASLTDEESMLLGLIQDSLKGAQASASPEVSAAQPVTQPQAITQKSEVTPELTQPALDGDLINTLVEMSPETAQKATNAFADRIVAMMPNASAQQQQAVKTNVVSALNEFQQQVAQGREPGIDVSSMIADAMSEANIPATTTQSVLAQLDTQVGAFMQLVNQSQSAAYQSAQHGMSQSESLISENNQVRAESSKAQQQLDGMDKPVNVLKPEGQAQLSEKIRWMVNARNAMAEIRLDPPELGSMQVRVNVSGESATVNFVVQTQHAKDALADTMPKLRDMLQEQGISLGESTVQQEARSQSNGEQGQEFAGGSNNNDIELDEDTSVIEQGINLDTEGGIDFYA